MASFASSASTGGARKHAWTKSFHISDALISLVILLNLMKRLTSVQKVMSKDDLFNLFDIQVTRYHDLFLRYWR